MKGLITRSAAVLVFVLLASCRSEVAGDALLFASAGPDRQMRVGETETLIAGGRKVPGLIYRWQIASPAGSPGLSADGPEATFTPEAVGAYVLSLTVQAGETQSAPDYMNILVGPGDRGPVALPSAHTLAEDTPLTAALQGKDPDGQALRFALVALPARGTVTLDDAVSGVFTYDPAADISGDDGFTFVVSAGGVTSAAAMVSLTITPVNDAPVARDSSFTVDLASTVNGTLGASDIEGDPLTFALGAPPTKGSATLLDADTGAFVYTASPGQRGLDTFTFSVSDASETSPEATIRITIDSASNRAPVADPGWLTVAEDLLGRGTLGGSDPDLDPITFTLIGSPGRGSVVLDDPVTGAFTYTPAANENGKDSFTFIADDGLRSSAEATIEIEITPVNDLPVAIAGTMLTPEDTPVSGVLDGTDIDGDALTFSLVGNATQGQVTLDNATTGAFTYTPDPDIFGTDSFIFRVNDGTADSAAATVTLTVTPVNDPPLAADMTPSVAEDQLLAGTLVGLDVDGDPLTFAISGAATHGTALIGDPLTGAYTYTPDPDWNGTDTFTFSVDDGLAPPVTAQVTVTVTPVNDPPVIAPLVDYDTDPNRGVYYAPVLIDEGGGVLEDPQAISVVSATSSDQGVMADGNIGFTVANVGGAAADGAVGTLSLRTPALGTATITVTVSDDGGTTTSSGSFLLTVASGSSRPYAYNVAASTPLDTPVTVSLKAHDYVAGDPITTWEILRPPLFGTLSGTPPNLTYTPALGRPGIDNFPYRVIDAGAESSRNALVKIVVSGAAAMVVGDAANLVGTDVQVHDALVAEGYTVTLIDDNNAATGDGAGQDLLVLSGSANAGLVAGTYTDEVVPILVWDGFVYDNMNLVPGNSGADHGTTLTDSVVILDPDHPLAAGLSGTVVVTVGNEYLVWGTARANAQVAYSSAGGDPMGFFYGQNYALYNGTTAAHRRVAIFLPNSAAGTLTPDGLRLVEAAISQTIAY